MKNTRETLIQLSCRRVSLMTMTLAALAITALSPPVSAAEAAADMYDRIADALRYESADGSYSLRFGGRLHADAAWYDEDRTLLLNNGTDSGTEFRRARLFVSGQVLDDWRFRFEHDFAAKRDFRIKSAWVAYKGFKPVTIRVGNVLQPFSLEEMTSSNQIIFMERSLANAFTRDYKLGALLTTYGDNWGGAAGVFGNHIRSGGDDGWGLAGRFTLSPVNNDREVVHLGIAAEYREPDKVSYSARPESHRVDNRLISTGTISNVDATVTLGLEAAATRGPLRVQAEYMQAGVSTTTGTDADFSGWYAAASWLLTGEQRSYNSKKGTFRKLRPQSHYGAWEVAARYSALDLQDGGITGGEESNVTLALNWYVNRNVRLMANYIFADADPNSGGLDDSPEIFQLRGQVVF